MAVPDSCLQVPNPVSLYQCVGGLVGPAASAVGGAIADHGGSAVAGAATSAVGGALSDTISASVGPVMDAFASWVGSQMGNIASTVVSVWTNTPTVSVGDESGVASTPVAFIRDHLIGYVALIAVASVIIGGVKIAVGGRPNGLGELGVFLARVAIAGTASVAVVSALISASDAFSDWIISESTNGAGLGPELNNVFTSAVGGFIGLICVIVMFLASLYMVGVMWARSCVLVLGTGMLPIAAAVLSPAWFGRLAKVLMASLLIKPLAALIIATSFALLQQFGADTTTEAIVGATMMAISAWSWKWCVRIVAPWDDVHGQTGLGGAVARTAAFVAIVAR